MESTGAIKAVRQLDNNNIDKNNSDNCAIVSDNEKETEMEIDNSLENVKSVPSTFSNNPEMNLQRQDYFSFFYKETLWPSPNVILYELVLPGSVSLQLDMNKLIPRIMEINDKRSKCSVSELLHTIVTLTLGKKSMDLFLNKYLFSTMFKIGVSNDAVSNLMQKFVMQLVHYLSSKSICDIHVPMKFLDILFQCLNYERDFIVKDYISICVKEFLQSLLNLLPKQDRQNSLIYHYTIHKIINLATYPFHNEALTAAFAFNHLFTLCMSPYLNMIVPNKYWLEFLHSFLINLENCNEEQVERALCHIKDTICARTSIFNAKFLSRRKPSDFPNEKLEGAVTWLFEKSASKSALLRYKCMSLFEDLCEHVSNIKSTKDFVDKYVDKYDVKYLNSVAMKGLDGSEDVSMENLRAFARTLDFYTWIFNKKMSTPEVVFIVDKNERDKIIFLNVFGGFVSVLVNKKVEETIKEATTSTEEAKKMLELLNSIVLKIFTFISSIFVAKNIKNFIKNIWNDNLCLLVSRFTLCPQKLGFSEQRLSTVKPKFLETFFSRIKVPPTYLTKLHKNFFVGAQEELQNFTDVQHVISVKDDLFSLKYFVNSMTMLKNLEFINFEKQLNFTTTHTKEKITVIVEDLKSNVASGNLKENIDANVFEYFKSVLNFFLLSYKPELVEFMINLISSEYSCTNGAPTAVFFETFKQLILEFFLKEPVETLERLNTLLLSSPEKFLLLLESLLVHATNNPSDNSKILSDKIIRDCSCYKDLILDIQYHDWLLKINRLAVSLVTDPITTSEDLSDPLTSYVLDEFDKAETAAKRIAVVDGFIKCFTDGSRASKTHIVSMFQKLKEERSQAPRQQLCALIEKLAAMKSWQIWEGIILLTCGAGDRFFENVDLVEHAEDFLSEMSSESVLFAIESILAISIEASPDEKLDVVSYFLLPFIDSCHDAAVLKKFYEDNSQDLYALMVEEMSDSDVASRKRSLINRIACYRVFELMYCKLPFGVIIDLPIEGPVTEHLNIALLKCSLKVRNFTAKFDEEKELARLLHCSALNAYVAMASQQVDKSFQNLIFKEDRANNYLLWEKIVDCEKKYEFRAASSAAIRQVSVVSRKTGDRMRLSLEKDELNGHECMGTIVAIFLHMHDNKSAQPPRDALPEWMAHFHAAFGTNKDNVVLYLLRVMVNARRAFLPCVHLFLEPVVEALCSYLRENKINYLVRDVLLMILETGCELNAESEVQAGQKLVEALVRQAQDPDVSVCEYNVDVIEKLTILWASKLTVPANLIALIESDKLLAVRIILVLLKREELRHAVAYTSEVQAIVRSRMFRWREPLTPQIIEILGFMVSCIPEEARDRTIEKSLVPIFKEMRRAGSADLCAHMFYLMFNTCPSLAKHEHLLQFITPDNVSNDECRAECFEMFLDAMTDLEPSLVHSRLDRMRFADLLRDETMLPCVEVGFRIIDKLVTILDARQLLPYARAVERYARRDALLEHKSNAIWFFIGIYKKYCAHSTLDDGDEHTKNLSTLSEQVLINGVSDPSDEMQEEVLDFWRDRLTESTVDRLKRLMDMFSLEVHLSYAQFLCLLMLDLTNKYSDNQKLLFGPLTPCSKENQEVVVSRKSRSKAAAQKASQGQKSKSPTNIDDGARQKVDNADVKLSRRTFTANDEIDELAFLYPTVTRNYAVEYDQKLKAQKLEQENFMKFNRIYKETYLPDVEITQADVVTTIEDYAKRCSTYAADLSVSIVCGMLDHFRGTETYNEILESLANMCKKALKEANEFAPVAMEILYKCDCPFDADDVLRIALSMDLQLLGILILEKKTTSYDYEDLYCIGKKFPRELEFNVHLAMLYRSIDEPDVVESIFKNWKYDSNLECLREASIAEREMEWTTAKEAYEEGFNESSGIIKDYCMEGMFECLSQLSSWARINETIDKTIVGDGGFNSIWRHPNRERVLPWMFKAQLQEKLENLVRGQASESEFSDQLEAWVNERGDSITRPFGEELSLFFLCNGDSTMASRCLESCLRDMHEKWDLKESYQRVLDKFKRLKEIEMYMKAVDKDPVDGTGDLIDYWETNVPKVGDDTADWDIKLNYRMTFANLLSNWLKDVSMHSDIVDNLIEADMKQQFYVNDLALKYKNAPVARKYCILIKKNLDAIMPAADDEPLRRLDHQLKLVSCQYAILQFENESDTQRRIYFLIKSWQIAFQLYQSERADAYAKAKSSQHIFKLAQSFRALLLTDDAAACLAAQDSFVSQMLDTNNPVDIVDMLFHFSLNTLRDACQKEDKLKDESFAMFAEYCQRLLVDVHDRESVFQKEFTHSLLQAMSFGSKRAAQYFPCLLKNSVYENNEELTSLFKATCEIIPSSMFLGWQEEIISHLATPLADLVLPIVKKLCNDFPSAIIFALQKVRNNPVADELYRSTFADSKYDTFFDAMEFLCQPEEYLRHRLQELVDSISNSETLSAAIKSMLSKDSANATVFKKVPANYRKEFEKLTNVTDITVAKIAIQEICMALQKTMAQRMEKNELTESTKLSYYSSFLNDFAERNFEVDVPIQCNTLHQRPKIVKFDRFVRVLPSKSSSLVIKIVGSDGKTYEFLVKCGLDLRQNQKMQRIFKIANGIFNEDLNCCKRHLSVGTYSVATLSTSTGLIQWVPSVRSLEEIVEYSLADKSIVQTTKEKYQDWINDASADETSSESLLYQRAFAKYSADVVCDKMIELTKDIKPNLIQQSFLQISPSLEKYFKMRQNFIKSYATMCLTHWLFGVGDRRMKNILVDVSNGDCFGINFDLILGAAAELPVPELVPFRLTAQIVNFMKPFTERDLFGATMCHVLKALQNDSSLVIGCLEAFLEEPIKWNAKLNLLWKNEDETHNGVKWLPKKKIEILTQKFSGTKPSKIMADEFSFNEHRYSSLYHLIVDGNEILHVTARSTMKNHDLTPEEQVLCLLDQATDVNTVGRMWADWKCFV